MTQTDETAPRGWKTTLDDDRTIEAWPIDDGKVFCFRFTNKGNVTDIRLSREAVNAMKVLMMQHVGGLDA